MANPTTNFGWVMPTSANLIGDLPTNFNTFGQGVDTSMLGLLGGTTGQYLAKTSATSMAFTWTTLGAYATWTPTFTNFTLGNGTITYARYAQVGKIVFLNLVVTLGSTSSVTGLIQFTLPVTAASGSNSNAQTGLLADASPANNYLAITSITGGTTVGVYASGASGTYTTRLNTSSTVPITWTTNDVWSCYFTYEAA